MSHMQPALASYKGAQFFPHLLVAQLSVRKREEKKGKREEKKRKE
jgi:hypothetical protein